MDYHELDGHDLMRVFKEDLYEAPEANVCAAFYKYYHIRGPIMWYSCIEVRNLVRLKLAQRCVLKQDCKKFDERLEENEIDGAKLDSCNDAEELKAKINTGGKKALAFPEIEAIFGLIKTIEKEQDSKGLKFPADDQFEEEEFYDFDKCKERNQREDDTNN